MLPLTRIDPNDPLTRAARETNEKARAPAGLPGVLKEIGMTASPEQVFYLAQQRAIRSFAAFLYDYNMGVAIDQREDEAIAKRAVCSHEWRRFSSLVIASYVDGFAIGWRGSQLATETKG